MVGFSPHVIAVDLLHRCNRLRSSRRRREHVYSIYIIIHGTVISRCVSWYNLFLSPCRTLLVALLLSIIKKRSYFVVMIEKLDDAINKTLHTRFALKLQTRESRTLNDDAVSFWMQRRISYQSLSTLSKYFCSIWKKSRIPEQSGKHEREACVVCEWWKKI